MKMKFDRRLTDEIYTSDTVRLGKDAFQAVYPFVEEAPDARLAVTDGAKVGGRIGVGKRELAVLSFEISLLAGEADHVGSVEHVLFIFQVELVNAALVGVSGNATTGKRGNGQKQQLQLHF